MYDRNFFKTKLGHAAIASIAMMTVFVALSSQLGATSPIVFAIQPGIAGLA